MLTSLTSPAAASPGAEHKVTLCHRTNADTNPYVEITVDVESVFKRGHDGHTGPVWNPSLKASHTKWGDIIPAFDYKDKKGNTLHYNGMNQTTEGKAVLAAGCVAQTSTPTPTPTVSEKPTPKPTPSVHHTPKTHVIPPVHVTKPPKANHPHKAQKPETLPFTGAATGILGGIGGFLLLLGSGLLYLTRKPKHLAKHAKV